MADNHDNPDAKSYAAPMQRLICADCGCVIRGIDWQLEDGRTVCQRCCVADTKRIVRKVIGGS